jgi:hypothetical protein
VLLQFTPDRLHDDTSKKSGAADEVAQASHPTAIAANAVVRYRQPRNRLGIELGAIQPRAPAPAGCTRRRQLEQSRVAPDLTDNGVTALHRCPDHRAPHVPGIEQQTQGTKTVANRPQQGLGQGDLPGMTDAAAQAGQDRNRARPVAARYDSAERDEGLAQQEGRAVRLSRMIKSHSSAGRLGRATRCQRVVDYGEASRPAGLALDDAAQRGNQTKQPEAASREHPVVGLPAQPWCQRQHRPRHWPTLGQHGADHQFGEGAPGGPRDGQHDLLDPSRQRRREGGLRLRCHGAIQRLVRHPQHGAGRPPAPPRTRRIPQGRFGLETPVKSG